MKEPTFGKRPFATLYQDINTLRRLIREQGTPEIQDAWDQFEPHIDAAYAPQSAGAE